MINATTKLSKLIADATINLEELNYATATKKNYIDIWRKLHFYAVNHGISDFSLELGYLYLKTSYSIYQGMELTQAQAFKMRSIKVLNDFMITGGITGCYHKKSIECPAEFKDLLQGYDEYIRSQVRASTSNEKKRHTILFLSYVYSKGITVMSMVSANDVLDFTGTLKKYAIRTKEGILFTLRSFLHYLFISKNTVKPLERIFPVIPVNKLEKLPSHYSTDEIKKILKEVDRNSIIGRRDYIILLLAAQLGLRAGDIRGLEYKNVFWGISSIKLIQQKTMNSLVLPMPDSVKYAMIDYLKNSRHKSEDPHLFIRNCAPFLPFASSNSFSDVIKKYMKLARIDISLRKHGIHSLRHSLADNLLQNDIPLPVITGILGHDSSETTKEYLRIDMKKLKSISLEVPYGN